jgi:hypothetical protein
MAARASPIAIQPSVAVLVAGFVFAERDVLALAFTSYVKAMIIKECVRQSLEATFGRARSLVGHALLVSEADVGSSFLVYLSGAVSRSAMPGRGSRKSSMEHETLFFFESV